MNNITTLKSHVVISAIIACYGDALAVPVMYERLTKVFRQLHLQYEIIFVNDGSPDDAETVIDALVARDFHVVGIHHARNFGSQMAFTSGMAVAQGQAVVLMDGDLQDPPELIPQFYEKWQQGFQVVYGVRTRRVAPFMMRFLYKAFYRIFQRLSYIKIPLDAGDFSLIDKQVVEVLLTMPERDRFLRGLRAWVGFRQTGVPYLRPERMFGHTTNNLLRNIRWSIQGIVAFSYVPLQFIAMISLGVFVLSAIGVVAQIALRLLYPGTPQGITTVLVVVMFLGATQLLSLSIVGEYVAKIFEEVKQRPQYVVKRVNKKST